MRSPKQRRKAETQTTLTPTELLTNNIDEVQTFLMHIDTLIRKADENLAKLQPPHGRIRVEWYECKMGWAQGGRCPEVVRWRLTGNGAWQAERLPRARLANRAKRNGWFRETYEQVRSELETVGKLMALRARLTTIVSQHIMTINALRTGNMEMMLKTEAEQQAMEDWLKANGESLLWAKEFPQEGKARKAGT